MIELADSSHPLSGVTLLGEDFTAIDIWQSLHQTAQSWKNIPAGASQAQDRVLLDGTDLSVIRTLQDFPAERWANICEGVGWTAYGAAGLSWCQGADLAVVCEQWQKSGLILKPTPESERPARLLNPALLPTSRQLSTLIQAASGTSFMVCVFIAAKPEPLIFDLPFEKLKTAKAQPAAFLKHRLQQQPNRTKQQEQLIHIWGEAIRDTAYAG